MLQGRKKLLAYFFLFSYKIAVIFSETETLPWNKRHVLYTRLRKAQLQLVNKNNEQKEKIFANWDAVISEMDLFKPLAFEEIHLFVLIRCISRSNLLKMRLCVKRFIFQDDMIVSICFFNSCPLITYKRGLKFSIKGLRLFCCSSVFRYIKFMVFPNWP